MAYNLIPKSKDGKYILTGCTLYYPLSKHLKEIKIDRFAYSLKRNQGKWIAERGDEYYNIEDLYADKNNAKNFLRDKINLDIKILKEYLEDLDNV